MPYINILMFTKVTVWSLMRRRFEHVCALMHRNNWSAPSCTPGLTGDECCSPNGKLTAGKCAPSVHPLGLSRAPPPCRPRTRSRRVGTNPSPAPPPPGTPRAASENGLTLAQTMQAGSRIPVGTQLEK
jgi:hypothetical protein